MQVDGQVAEVLRADRLRGLPHAVLHPVEVRVQSAREQLGDIAELELCADATDDPLGTRASASPDISRARSRSAWRRQYSTLRGKMRESSRNSTTRAGSMPAP